MARVPGVEWVQQKITEAIGGVTPGSIGAAPLAHADRHAAGGADPITPASIKAYPTEVGTLTGADNLDTLTTPGTYFLGSSSGVTKANGYPLDGWAGWVEVQNRLTSTIQKAYSIYTNPGGGGSTTRNVWVRTQVGGQWGAWMRLDPSAVTPASIGALSQAPITVTYTGSASDPAIRGGTYRVMAADITTANGYPSEMVANPPTVAYLWVQEYSTDGAKTYATQWLSTSWNPGTPQRKLWFRENYGGWRPWREVAFRDQGLQDTGWRVVTSWTHEGVVTGDPLPTNITPQSGRAGYIRWRREGNDVTLSFTGATFTASAQVSIPTGFAPANGEWPVIPVAGVAVMVPVGAQQIYLPAVPPTTVGYAHELRWRSRLPWPTILPGTPA